MIKLLNSNRRARIIFILIGITVVYFTWRNAQIVYNPLHITNISLRLAFRGIITSIPMLIFLLCLYKPSKIIESIGLNRNILKGLGFAALCCSPLLIGMPIVGTLYPSEIGRLDATGQAGLFRTDTILITIYKKKNGQRIFDYSIVRM